MNGFSTQCQRLVKGVDVHGCISLVSRVRAPYLAEISQRASGGGLRTVGAALTLAARGGWTWGPAVRVQPRCEVGTPEPLPHVDPCAGADYHATNDYSAIGGPGPVFMALKRVTQAFFPTPGPRRRSWEGRRRSHRRDLW